MKVAKIRGQEKVSGMICAEDEIGLGSSHAGILFFPQICPRVCRLLTTSNPIPTGSEIGLTPTAWMR